MCYRSSRLLQALLFVFFSSAGLAQDGSFHDVKVEVSAPHEKLLIGYTVNLHQLHRPEDIIHSSTEFGDTYVFRHIESGEYVVRVFNANGTMLKEDLVRVGGGDCIVRMDLPQPKTPSPGAGVVSVRQLQHPPSKKAMQAFHAAQKHAAASRPDKAAAELERAISFSPDYAPAHTNLAAMRIRLYDYEGAIREAGIAMQIASPNIYDLSNQALAQWALARYDDAIRSAEQALRLDPNFATANFVLGSLLAQDPKTVGEGIRHLEVVAERFPDAARNLARARAMVQSVR